VVELFKRLHVDKTNNVGIQFYRYLFVGGLAFVLDFTVLFVLTNYLNLYYIFSATISFLLGSVVNYYLCIAWIFPQRNMKSKMTEFWLFKVIGFSGVFLNALVMYTATHFFGIYYLVSKVISAAIVFSWNFFVRKFFLFSNSKPALQEREESVSSHKK